MNKNRKVHTAWAMYDWANSTYHLVITSTIFPAYYVAVTSNKENIEESYVNFFGLEIINTALQNYALGIVFLIVAIASPILSSIADYRGNKKAFMKGFTWLGSMSCMALFFSRLKELNGESSFSPSQPWDSGAVWCFTIPISPILPSRRTGIK